MTEPSAPITINITATFMLHFFSVPWQDSGTNLAFYFNFSPLAAGTANSPIRMVLFFCWQLLIWSRLGDTFVCQNLRSLFIAFSRIIFKLLAQWITPPTTRFIIIIIIANFHTGSNCENSWADFIYIYIYIYMCVCVCVCVCVCGWTAVFHLSVFD